MPTPLEDYALIGDRHSAALVAKDGSIDWLCLPRFDSAACFAALLGGTENGRWQLAPVAPVQRVTRRYRPRTLVLETRFETAEGVVLVVDFMPIRRDSPIVARWVIGEQGRVAMRMELVIRFEYGSVVPWVVRNEAGIEAIAGPDLLQLVTPVETRGEELKTLADFTVAAGDRVPFVLTWYPSHVTERARFDPEAALVETTAAWTEWAGRSTYHGAYEEAVGRSLLTLDALTYAPTGGIVAAPTTSLPEQLGGVRNWDYRYCWIRDATFTLYALMSAGYSAEARAWCEWLLRAVAGSPAQLQIMYGIAGERRFPELELDWLAGYAASTPVRVGNAASKQLQLDVFGELMDALHVARRFDLKDGEAAWRLQRRLVNHLAEIWEQPDEGIWEVRGPRRHFTHSKVMAWVAFDRAVKAVEQHGLEGPVDRWRAIRSEVHASVCRYGFDRELGSFVQSYDRKELDASLLMVPLVGFLPPHDPRVVGTVCAIERGLVREGFVQRYSAQPELDGLPAGEGSFLACSFWLADNYGLQGRETEARNLFERLVGLSNDVGLLAEEYDPRARWLVGNFPQAFSHVSLVNSALNLELGTGPATQRTST